MCTRHSHPWGWSVSSNNLLGMLIISAVLAACLDTDIPALPKRPAMTESHLTQDEEPEEPAAETGKAGSGARQPEVKPSTNNQPQPDGPPPCSPNCDDRECGADGCGGSCGSCSNGSCGSDGWCECQPSCAGTVCGDDGCGSLCGVCAGNLQCARGACLAPSGNQTLCSCTPTLRTHGEVFFEPMCLSGQAQARICVDLAGQLIVCSIDQFGNASYQWGATCL